MFKLYKSSYGWTAETRIPIPNLPNRFLKVLTMKRFSGLIVTTCMEDSPEGGPVSTEYSKVLAVFEKRATERAVREQHQFCLSYMRNFINR